MKIGNFAHELADMRAEQERDAGIAAARTAEANRHAGLYPVRG
ncbi:hypothetical protein [Brucella intermedia]|nr:hypothetical protein [Brucella intermedia]